MLPLSTASSKVFLASAISFSFLASFYAFLSSRRNLKKPDTAENMLFSTDPSADPIEVIIVVISDDISVHLFAIYFINKQV
jgi:hypothetical protein